MTSLNRTYRMSSRNLTDHDSFLSKTVTKKIPNIAVNSDPKWLSRLIVSVAFQVSRVRRPSGLPDPAADNGSHRAASGNLSLTIYHQLSNL